MISADFAPNEDWSDARLSLKLLFQPWRWYNGKESDNIKSLILSQFKVQSPKFTVNTFLTGRAALYHLLQILNLPEGTEIAVQGFTCEAVVLPILALKLKPVYIDIEKSTFSMDPIDLEKKLSDSTKVVILQHTFGLTPLQRNKIMSIIKKRQLVLIEDIAHGVNNLEFKTNNLKHYFLLSFGRSKAISSVFGGAVISQNKLNIPTLRYPSLFFIFIILLYKPLAMLIKSTYDIFIGKILHKIFNSAGLLSHEITGREKKGEYDPSLDKAYPNALAILLLHQLNKYEQTQLLRAQITSYYSRCYKLHATSYMSQSLIRYPLLINNRLKALQKAQEHNIYLGKWYDQVVAPKGLDLNQVRYKKGSCPAAETICQQIINLPTNITLEEAKRITLVLSEVEGLNDVICK